MSRRKDLPGLMGPALVLGAFAALVIAERRLPLRRRVEPDGRRQFARNLAMAGLTAAVLQVAERPIVRPLARVGEERRLGLLPALRLRWMVTPRMHGIRHSTVREETEANWSSGLTLWDRLHGTLCLNVPQRAVTIGVPTYRAPDEVILPKLVTMPFGRQRPAWRLTGDGRPRRAPAPIAASTMAP